MPNEHADSAVSRAPESRVSAESGMRSIAQQAYEPSTSQTFSGAVGDNSSSSHLPSMEISDKGNAMAARSSADNVFTEPPSSEMDVQELQGQNYQFQNSDKHSPKRMEQSSSEHDQKTPSVPEAEAKVTAEAIAKYPSHALTVLETVVQASGLSKTDAAEYVQKTNEALAAGGSSEFRLSSTPDGKITMRDQAGNKASVYTNDSTHPDKSDEGQIIEPFIPTET